MARRSRRPSERPTGERRIALFGGTFDPIHAGHLAVARAAHRRFHLDEIHFIPTAHPPHKREIHASFMDRYAMVALACADHPHFITSLAESDLRRSNSRSAVKPAYTIDTVRRFKRALGTSARLFYMMGADSFLEIRTWKNYAALLGLCDFIVVNRPGADLSALRKAIPAEMLAPRGSAWRAQPRVIALRRASVFVLDSVHSDISATEVRHRLASNKSFRALVPPRVEEYISKQALYR
jgi:nicotinate-nucleotide adenylyltransferase